MNYYILNKNDEPVVCNELFLWSKWRETSDKHVGKTEIKGIYISTVFLGLDYNFFDQGPPVLWETMIFGGEHDEYQERYTSKKAALAGHEKACALVRGET